MHFELQHQYIVDLYCYMYIYIKSTKIQAPLVACLLFVWRVVSVVCYIMTTSKLKVACGEPRLRWWYRWLVAGWWWRTPCWLLLAMGRYLGI